MTTFNHERYIKDCLDRILGQVTEFDFEIIIADDASSDSTHNILVDYQQRNPEQVRVFHFQTNQRSKCLPVFSRIYQASRGKYIACCDGDDYWPDKHKLQKQIDFLEYHHEFSMCFHDAVSVDTNGLPLNNNFPDRLKRDFSPEQLMQFEEWIFLGTMMFRKVMDTLPPEFDLVPNRDNFLPIFLGEFGAAKFMHDIEPLMWRKTPGSLWTSKSLDDQQKMHLTSRLFIAAYYSRTKNYAALKKLVLGKLSNELNWLFRFTKSDRRPPA